MMELQIDAPAKDLEDLRQLLLTETNERVDLQEITSAGAGELREPVLTSIIIALGGPAVVTAVVAIVKRWADHREAMRQAELAKFRLLSQATTKDLTLQEVLALAEEARR